MLGLRKIGDVAAGVLDGDELAGRGPAGWVLRNARRHPLSRVNDAHPFSQSSEAASVRLPIHPFLYAKLIVPDLTK
jgi:hypothetical protein